MGNKYSNLNASEPSAAGVNPSQTNQENTNGNSSRDNSSSAAARGVDTGEINIGNLDEIIPGDMSYWQLAKLGYQEVVNAIIRPPRCEYSPSQLGPAEFSYCGKMFIRTDFELTNSRNLKFVASHWEPVDYSGHEALPCVIYLHGNSSCRLESLTQISTALSIGASFCSLDFSGSGLSEGAFVTLGYYESEDVSILIKHLQQNRRVSSIALWGRSMGAATCIHHTTKINEPTYAQALIIDSPFSSLTSLAREMGEKGLLMHANMSNGGGNNSAGLLQYCIPLVLKFVSSSVFSKANFHLDDLDLLSSSSSCYTPALFIAGMEDDFIPPHHAQDLHKAWGGDKNLVLVDGGHNSNRPGFLYDSIAIFLQQYLQIPPELALHGGSEGNGTPPWISRGIFDGFDLDALQDMGVQWQCATCSLLNGERDLRCIACGNLKV